jgi:hypothetical protein
MTGSAANACENMVLHYSAVNSLSRSSGGDASQTIEAICNHLEAWKLTMNFIRPYRHQSARGSRAVEVDVTVLDAYNKS